MSFLMWTGYLGGGVLVLLATLFVLYTIYISYIHYKYSHIPSPRRSSFYMGHVADLIYISKVTGNDDVPMATAMKYWMDDVKTTTFVVFFFHTPEILTVDPEVIKEVVMNIKNDKSTRFVSIFHTIFGERFLGKGLVSLKDYDSWKPRRKLYDPAFTKSYLKTLVATFNACIDHFLKKLESSADGKTIVSMEKKMFGLTLDVISKTAFGTDFSEQWNAKSLGITSPVDESETIFSYITNKALKGVDVSFRSFYPSLNQYLHPFEARGYQESVRAMRKIGRDCIMKRIKTIECGEQPPNDILTHILEVASTKGESDIEVLIDDFCTYFVAGSETTSNLLSFVIYLLHENPGIMERLISEVDEVLGDRRSVTVEDLEKLQYTEQVLNETLRLYPPVFGISKCLHSTSTLGGHSIPAGTIVLMITATMCRMPEHFSDPDTFDPSRFDPENKKPNSFVFFPFGLGHRSCIGRHFAMMEAKIALARFVQTYRISFSEDFKLVEVQRTTLQPKDLPCTLLPAKSAN